uniref:C2H2-type domain-containing protein n=1 Tax=Oryza meridionalis TaxID=40149 RepID=A0A0E0F2X9_9ORYZ
MEASAAKEKDKGGKKMSRVGSWGSMAFYSSSSSSSRNQPVSAAAAAAEGKNGGGGGVGKKEKRRSSISRSITCAGSICSTKESSVSSRGRGRRRRSGGGGGGDGGSTSSRSLMGPEYHGDSAAAVSASSSFNSVMTAATSATAATTTTSSSATSPPSALSSPLSSIVGGSFRAMQIRKLSGCYLHCHSVLDPRTLAAVVFSCPDCDEVFVKPDSLELHRSTRHAVSELGADDTSRNIVEIIFQSSWLKKNAPVCKIERILKVQSSDKTIKRFEQHKEAVKEKARSAGDEAGRNPRCVADGNELLRFHCTAFSCSLGLAGGTALCCASSSPPPLHCKLCSIIKDGFRVDCNGRIATMATSGRAHDTAEVLPDGEKRAMLVCRVVAGRVKKLSSSNSSEDHDCDSVSPYSDLDELFVFSPRAILPCFVVIYSGY